MIVINQREDTKPFNNLSVGEVFINEYGEFMMKTDGESQSLAVGLVSGRLYRMSNTEKCTVVKATLTVE